MKVGIITDTHFGHKRGNQIFLESQLKFFREQFIPRMKKEGITTLFILGDLFDNRVNIDSKILNAVLDLFNIDLIDFEIYIIVGNHDSYLESSVEINSVKAIGFFDNVTAIDKNTSITLDGRTIYLCPWITDKKAFTDTLETLPNHDLCFGHFEFTNFLMFKGKECEKGVDSNLFYDKFKLTMSGHFHTRSNKIKDESEIVYIGNPYHMTRNDIGDERGFCILDLKDLTYELINNDVSIKFVSYKYPKELQREDIENNHVDVFVDYDEKYDEVSFQKYIEKLESYNPAFPINVKMVNKFNVDSPDIKVTSLQDLITEYLDNVEVPNKDKIQEKILKLYSECVNDI